MATTKTTNITPTNTTEVVDVKLVELGLATNYNRTVSSKGSSVALLNGTTPLDSDELITITGRKLATVNNNIGINSEGGVLYDVTVQTPVRTVIDSDNCDCTDAQVDEPIVVRITVRHPKTSNTDLSIVESTLRRALSVFYKNDGTSRLGAFARLQLVPTED